MKGQAFITLVGNVGRDPEMRFSPNGNQFTSFSVAVNHRDKDGKELVDWYSITCFGKLAEIVNDHLKKGNGVAVNGVLTHGTFKDRNGALRQSLDVVANNVIFTGNAQATGDSDNKYANHSEAFKKANELYDSEDEDEIPF